MNISPEQVQRDLQATGVQTLLLSDPLYPKLLKEIYDPPQVLYYRGSLGAFPDEACIAVVGSRKMSSYGSAAMPLVCRPLIKAGITVVSGLAYGADSAAHAESVKAGARTIAVLGTGVDDSSIYPRGHLRLAHQILDNGGLIISEKPPYTPGLKQNFVARNRIIAGLSLGVVIVECKTKSGALLTADFAADYNRSLYAIPGPIYSSLSAGPHQLIKNGAALITTGEEILQDNAISIPQRELSLNNQQFTRLEMRMLECMQVTPMNIDAIVKATSLPAEAITPLLTSLELRGAIKNMGASGFIKVP